MVAGTNLFEFAPRELSQSAFWAWILQSVDPEEGSEDVGLVGQVLLRRIGVPVPRNKIEVVTEHRLAGDAGRVDIHAKIDGTVRLVIEHKVSGALLPDQLKRYRDSVDDSVHCLFLSTSYDLRKRRTTDGFLGFGDWRVLDAERLLEVLRSTASTHPTVVDYQQWLEYRVGEWHRLEELALSEEPSDQKMALQTIPGQWKLMARLTESFSTAGRQYSRPARTSGEPWTEFRFLEGTKHRDSLFYRVETLSGGPVFRLKQYQPNPSWREKKKRRDELRHHWQECLDEVGTLNWVTPKDRGQKSSTVARIDLLGISASALKDELSAVHPKFAERLEEEIRWPVGRHEYSYHCRECECEFTIEQKISEYGKQVFPPDRCSMCAA